MTTEKFNEIILQCKMENPNFISNAIWSIDESKEPDSIKVKVALTRKIVTDGKTNEKHFGRILLTQNKEDSIFCAIMALNEWLLSQLD